MASIPAEPPKPRKMKFRPVARPRLIPKDAVKREVKEEPHDPKGGVLLKRFYEIGNSHAKLKSEVKHEVKEYALSRSVIPAASNQIIRKVKAYKEYKEPWDYYSYYPVTLPLRRPYSGDPVLLNKEEFGATTLSTELDEYSSNDAKDLGLMVEPEEPSILFLQLPQSLPVKKEIVDVVAKEAAAGSKPQRSLGPRQDQLQSFCMLNNLPAGHLGKLIVYKSGVVKLKLGDSFYNVSSGMNCAFPQDLVAIDTTDKYCCAIGELSKRAIVTPDLDSILNSLQDDTR